MAERLLHLLEDRGVNESASGDAASTVIGSNGGGYAVGPSSRGSGGVRPLVR
jgi:hypothetical protein